VLCATGGGGLIAVVLIFYLIFLTKGRNMYFDDKTNSHYVSAKLSACLHFVEIFAKGIILYCYKELCSDSVIQVCNELNCALLFWQST
jgi:hypothetical protein